MDIDDTVFSAKLVPGEHIVWSGQPARGLLLTSRDVFLVPFSVLWCGFAIFRTITATNGRAPGFFTLWGLMFVVAGLYFVVGALRRRRVVAQRHALRRDRAAHS